MTEDFKKVPFIVTETDKKCHFCSFLGQETLWNRHFEIFWPLAYVGLQLGSETTCLFDRLLVIPASASLMILYEMNSVKGEFFFINMELVNVGNGAVHAVVIWDRKCKKSNYNMNP